MLCIYRFIQLIDKYLFGAYWRESTSVCRVDKLVDGLWGPNSTKLWSVSLIKDALIIINYF